MMRLVFAVTIAAAVCAAHVSAQAPKVLQGSAPRGEERRDDIDAFQALLARGEIDEAGRCALPDGTARRVNSTLTFRLGQAYRCVEQWVRIAVPGSSPVHQVFEKRVTWLKLPPSVLPSGTQLIRNHP